VTAGVFTAEEAEGAGDKRRHHNSWCKTLLEAFFSCPSDLLASLMKPFFINKENLVLLSSNVGLF
jgi:hypothetical protein